MWNVSYDISNNKSVKMSSVDLAWIQKNIVVPLLSEDVEVTLNRLISLFYSQTNNPSFVSDDFSKIEEFLLTKKLDENTKKKLILLKASINDVLSIEVEKNKIVASFKENEEAKKSYEEVVNVIKSDNFPTLVDDMLNNSAITSLINIFLIISVKCINTTKVNEESNGGSVSESKVSSPPPASNLLSTLGPLLQQLSTKQDQPSTSSGASVSTLAPLLSQLLTKK